MASSNSTQLDRRVTFLSLVASCDNFPYDAAAEHYYYKLFLPYNDKPHGYVLPEVMEEIAWKSTFDIDDNNRTIRLQPCSAANGDQMADIVNMTFEDMTRDWIDRNKYNVLRRQHSERIAIPGIQYGSPVYIERLALPLFGIINQEAHLVAYCNDGSGMKIWICRLYAHLLTTAAGRVKSDASPLQTIVEDAYEIASLPRALTRERTRSRGVISHMGVTGEDFPGEKGLVTPGTICVYDVELPQGVKPRPHKDDKLSSFTLMTVEELGAALLRGEFRPDSAAVLVEYLIRHGFITPENEPEFVEINMRLHRRLPFRTG